VRRWDPLAGFRGKKSDKTNMIMGKEKKTGENGRGEGRKE